MSVLAATPGCVGINVPAQASYPTRVLAGHNMVDLPGGLTVVGSHIFSDATPRWVGLDRYSIAETATSEGQYRETMGKAGVADAPTYHPVTMVTYGNVLDYLAKRGKGLLTLPTEAQWENAARGPALNMQEVMEKEMGSFKPRDFAEFAEGRFENFVFGTLGQIFVNPKENELFRRMMEQGVPFFGWRVYGTPSGRLTPEEAWYDQRGTASVEWGPKGPYDTKGMTGGVWEWVGDWYSENVNMSDLWNPTGAVKGECRAVRGASWYFSDRHDLRAAYRFSFRPDVRNDDIGFRVAAPQGSGG